jgi:hypothetical protein
MIIITKRRYVKKHVVGGAGIMDTAASLFGRLLTSNAAKEIASAVGKKAVEAASNRLFSSPPQPRITQKTKDTLASLINDGVSIQDFVKKHGSGMKVV